MNSFFLRLFPPTLDNFDSIENPLKGNIKTIHTTWIIKMLEETGNQIVEFDRLGRLTIVKYYIQRPYDNHKGEMHYYYQKDNIIGKWTRNGKPFMKHIFYLNPENQFSTSEIYETKKGKYVLTSVCKYNYWNYNDTIKVDFKYLESLKKETYFVTQQYLRPSDSDTRWSNDNRLLRNGDFSYTYFDNKYIIKTTSGMETICKCDKIGNWIEREKYHNNKCVEYAKREYTLY